MLVISKFAVVHKPPAVGYLIVGPSLLFQLFPLFFFILESHSRFSQVLAGLQPPAGASVGFAMLLAHDSKRRGPASPSGFAFREAFWWLHMVRYSGAPMVVQRRLVVFPPGFVFGVWSLGGCIWCLWEPRGGESFQVDPEGVWLGSVTLDCFDALIITCSITRFTLRWEEQRGVQHGFGNACPASHSARCRLWKPLKGSAQPFSLLPLNFLNLNMPSMNTFFFFHCALGLAQDAKKKIINGTRGRSATWSASREITIPSDYRLGDLYLSLAHLVPICLHSEKNDRLVYLCLSLAHNVPIFAF